MSHHQILLLCYIILPSLIAVGAVKIGVSRPLSTTTATTTLATTTIETTVSEELDIGNEMEPSATTLTSSTTRRTTTLTSTPSTTVKTTTLEPEWPEFPPKKQTPTKTTTTTTTTTTRKPVTTTKKPKVTTPNPRTTEATEITNQTESTPETFALSTTTGSQHKYCFCDVTTNGCDINCCCDPDCTAEALTVFKCLKEDRTDFEIHEGRFEDFKFQHGLPSCEINDGWLCVFRTNIPPPQEKAHPSFSDTSPYYKWPNLLKEDLDTDKREFYMYGDALKLINVDTKDVRNFDLPSSLKHCQGKEPIRHLKTQTRTCLIPRDKDQLEEVLPNFWELQNKYKIFQKPTVSEELYNSKQLQNYIGNITLRWCNATLQKCQHYHEENVEYLDNVELNKIRINISHNFTNIHGIMIDLWLQRVNEDELPAESWRTYEVRFFNKTMKEMQDDENALTLKDYRSKSTSGPLGYTLGKPVILAKYVPVNKSLPLSEKNQELNYFTADSKAPINLGLFKKHKGQCKRCDSADQNEHISYGINLAKQCKIRMANETPLFNDDPSKTNFTIICLNLQDLIHRQLFGHDLKLADISSYFISQLGKPQNLSDKWLALNVYNADFSPVFGQYMENSGTFVCRNILLSLSYEFHIGTFDVDGGVVAAQRLIKHANLLMGARHDLEFSLDELLEVPLAMTVRFYDVNEKAASTSSCLLISLVMYFISLVIVLNV